MIHVITKSKPKQLKSSSPLSNHTKKLNWKKTWDEKQFNPSIEGGEANIIAQWIKLGYTKKALKRRMVLNKSILYYLPVKHLEYIPATYSTLIDA